MAARRGARTSSRPGAPRSARRAARTPSAPPTRAGSPAPAGEVRLHGEAGLREVDGLFVVHGRFHLGKTRVLAARGVGINERAAAACRAAPSLRRAPGADNLGAMPPAVKKGARRKDGRAKVRTARGNRLGVVILSRNRKLYSTRRLVEAAKAL